MYLKPVHRMGIMALSLAAPRRLAALFLRNPRVMPGGEVHADAVAERIEFPSIDGGLCRGWWLTPHSGAADRVVVVAHGWTSQYLRMESFVAPLLAGGNHVLLYDARGHGESDPTPYCSIRQFSDDLHHAIRFARGRVSRVAVLGHSLGASACLVSTAEGSGAERVVTVAAFADPWQASADILTAEQLPGERLMRRIAPYVESLIGCHLDSVRPERLIGQIGVPVLLVHGTDDTVVPVAHFHHLAAAAGEGLQRLLIDGADHDTIRTRPEVLRAVAEFLQA